MFHKKLCIAFLWLALSCRKDVSIPPNQNLLPPTGFPPISYPIDNPFNVERIALGKLLFFDPILSKDSTISCSSCHKTNMAFTDGLPKSVGIDQQLTARNTPSLFNIAYHPYFNRDGGVKSLELQALVPLQAHNEMNITIDEVEEKLMRNDSYRMLFEDVFNSKPTIYGITRALAAYQRTLIAANANFDRYFYYGEHDMLNAEEKEGMRLFFSEQAQCFHCHSGFNFTNYAFENTGLYENYTDQGRYMVTLDVDDQGKFKVPSLRNVSITAPYMHDGSLSSLEDVLQHYSSGGKNHINKSSLISQIQLNEKEQRQIIAFLKTLTTNE
jgi:cytochrome c peroxidase